VTSTVKQTVTSKEIQTPMVTMRGKSMEMLKVISTEKQMEIQMATLMVLRIKLTSDLL